MTGVRFVILATLGAVVLFAAITLVALEGREVVVLRTVDQQGNVRETRTWVADEDGHAWVEAANAERPFLRHVQANPTAEIKRGGAAHQCHAVAVANPEGHERIRRLLAEKYGWADRWIGLLTDTSGSLAIQLDCR